MDSASQISSSVGLSVRIFALERLVPWPEYLNKYCVLNMKSPQATLFALFYTGTHGTGIKFGNLAMFVVSLELVTGRGEVLTLSAKDNDTDLFKAAQVCIAYITISTWNLW